MNLQRKPPWLMTPRFGAILRSTFGVFAVLLLGVLACSSKPAEIPTPHQVTVRLESREVLYIPDKKSGVSVPHLALYGTQLSGPDSGSAWKTRLDYTETLAAPDGALLVLQGSSWDPRVILLGDQPIWQDKSGRSPLDDRPINISVAPSK